MCGRQKPRGEQDEPLIPNNLAELTSFLRKEVPARVTKQTLLTTKPWLDLQHEGGESVELARALKDCIPAEAGTQLLPGLLPLACKWPQPQPALISHLQPTIACAALTFRPTQLAPDLLALPQPWRMHPS